jgi:hypothetical protein
MPIENAKYKVQLDPSGKWEVLARSSPGGRWEFQANADTEDEAVKWMRNLLSPQVRYFDDQGELIKDL